MDPTIQSNGIISDNKTVNSKDTDDSKFLTLDSLIFDDSPPHITQIRPLTTHLYGNSAVASNKTSTGAISKTPASVEATQSLNSTAILEAELNGRYKVIEYISHGSYGVVYRAVDVQTNQHVAIKKAINIFDSSTTAKRLLREIKLLRMLKNHINIVKFIGVLAPVDPKTFNDLCLVFEYVDTDLQKLIQSNQHFGNLHIQYFLYQILCGISYIHSAGMLHRDVKPANILVNENCSLKLCDLGLARFAATSKPISNPIIAANTVQLTSAPMGQRELTKHVVTRWYRAPELVLLTDNYTPAIDMWSVGCILAELLTMQVESNCRPIDRKPLFPGKSCFPLTADDPLAYADAFDQLNLIFAVIGTPTIEQMARIDNPTARAYVLGLKPKNAVDLCQRYRAADPEAIDLLSKLLQFEPTQRITAVQALNHPYLTQMQDKTKLQLFEDLVDASNAVVQEFDWESNSHTREHIRQLIIQEVLIEQPVNIRSSKS